MVKGDLGAVLKEEPARIRPLIQDLWSSYCSSAWDTSRIDQENENRQTQEKPSLRNPLHRAPLSTPSLRTYYYRPSRRRLCGGCRLEDLVSDGSGQPGLEDHWSDGLEWPRGLGVHSLLWMGRAPTKSAVQIRPAPPKSTFT